MSSSPCTRSTAEHLDMIPIHIAWNVGIPAGIFREDPPGPVNVEVVYATARRPFHLLVTNGMSALSMRVPSRGGFDLTWAELAICLPPDWRLDEESLDDERWYWPLRLLWQISRYVHENDRFIWFNHGFGWDDAKPLGPGVPFTSVFIVESSVLPERFASFRSDPVREIHFLSLCPILREEWEWAEANSPAALAARLEERGVTDLVVPERPSVVG